MPSLPGGANAMNHHLPSILFAVVGVVFLISAVMGSSEDGGELFKFRSTALAGLLFLLAAIVAFFVRRNPGGR